jgi:hypothetical protein
MESGWQIWKYNLGSQRMFLVKKICVEENNCFKNPPFNFRHAHDVCYGRFANNIHPARKGTLTYKDVQFKTMWKEKCLRELGYEVKTVYECEIRAKLAFDPNMRIFFNDSNRWKFLRDPIKSSRDGYYGGRTEASVLHCVLNPKLVSEGYSIQDMDINSL